MKSEGNVSKFDEYKHKINGVKESTTKNLESLSGKITDISSVLKDMIKTDEKLSSEDTKKYQETVKILENIESDEEKSKILSKHYNKETVDRILYHLKHFGMMATMIVIAKIITRGEG